MRKVAAITAASLAVLGVLGVLGGRPALAQGGDADKIMAEVREALGGKKLDSVKSLTVEGLTLRTNAAGTTTEHPFEMAMELPDRYMKKEVLQALGNMSVYRTSGFNGDGLISEIDAPPQLSGGGHIVMRVQGPGGPGGPGGAATPEQQEAARKTMLANTKRDYARMILGVLGTSPTTYPLTFTYGGVAESPDGKADVIDVKGEGEFAARLFVDSQTHLPLMLSWMDKEPMVVQRVVGGPGGAGVPPPPPPPPGGGHAVVGGGAGGGATWTTSGGNVQVRQGGAPLTPEEQAKLAADMKEAEAKRRTVEFRIFYSDYQQVDGVTLPHRFQRSVDGKPTEEVVFERVKVNPKIDAKKFTVTKQ
jgi:hypothetical protein